MTNPVAALKMLVTYAVCIPLAIFVGYLLTNPMDYGTLGFLAFVVAALMSPIFIKWHYPILIFGLGCPIVLFFLPTRPPMWQAVVLISLSIAIVERTLSSGRRFFSVPAMTMPLMFLLATIVLTMELTGGIGFHQFGSSGGGGKKYVYCFTGIAIFYALVSRGIPTNQRNLYIFLYFFSAALNIFGDIGPALPQPLSYINLLIPPSSAFLQSNVALGVTRFGLISSSCNAVLCWMLARYGIRGIFLSPALWRLPTFCLLMAAAQLGGFRSVLLSIIIIFVILFFLERLHQTKLLFVFLLGGALAIGLMVPLAGHLPKVMQRSLAFLPIANVDSEVRMDAEGSSEWRLKIWRDLLPQIPQYLLLGKGYSFSESDFAYMGGGAFAGQANAASQLDSTQQALALSSDFHSGPLSTLIGFGIWGAIGMLWLMAATLWLLYRNHRYGDPELQTINTFLFASCVTAIIIFFSIFGAFQNDIGYFAKLAGLSVALNWGVRQPQTKPVAVQRIKPLPQPQAA
ncbi:MAG: O-antigen ligase family protein [Verrucomicrobiota bacterium]